jgi:DMSO/TMAO reductase YedYZ molybdopterin-dependent catalytic subunit
MTEAERFLMRHGELSRRYFLGCGVAGVTGLALSAAPGEPPAPELRRALDKLESYFTPPAEFQDVSRGNPVPHRLPLKKKREVGLTRESWQLEIVSDPDNPPRLGKQFTKKDGTALNFDALLKLGKRRSVRFAKVMTCLNIGCPLGMGVWEGLALRELVWLTRPKENLRRLFYHGYHNDDPKQLFRSSLPIGRVLEDPEDLPPVIACYKLNGRWLEPERGGPVRIVVPEAYGFKSVKWLTRVTLTNLAHANDTYANGNNDIDSPLKTFAATLGVPGTVKADERVPVTGYAQVGISGLAKVQVWVHPNAKDLPADDPYFTTAPWSDAEILAPPTRWGGKFPDDVLPRNIMNFDPKKWPTRLAKAHWAALLPGLPAGEYTLRCRTIDAKGHAQPMPRPFRKSGHCAIEAVKFTVKA